MIFDKLFTQYRKGQDERWFGSWWMKIHGLFLIGNPKQMGLEKVAKEKLDTYFYYKDDRFSWPEEINQDMIEYRQENWLISCLREAERPVISFAVFVLGLIICTFLIIGSYVPKIVSGEFSITKEVNWFVSSDATNLDNCKKEKSSDNKCKKLREVVAEKDEVQTKKLRASCDAVQRKVNERLAKGDEPTPKEAQLIDVCIAEFN